MPDFAKLNKAQRAARKIELITKRKECMALLCLDDTSLREVLRKTVRELDNRIEKIRI